MKEYKFIIQDEYDNFIGERVDKFLSTLLADYSRTFIQKIIKEQDLKVNDKVVKSSFKLNEDDEVAITIPDMILPNIEAQDIPLDIVFENSDYMIINKPKDMVVHPANGHYSNTVVNAIMFHSKDLSGIGGVLRPGIVHRIDKDTTGLLIICKNDICHRYIAEQLRVHSIERTYHAIVCGNLKEDEGTIDKAIGRSLTDRKKMAIIPTGKEAITHYKVLERFGKYTYIKCNLETGRTHQIRVHMASINHPLLGDLVYGNDGNFNTNGQVLHAKTLGFNEPKNNDYVEYDSNLPEYFQNILTKLRSSYNNK